MKTVTAFDIAIVVTMAGGFLVGAIFGWRVLPGVVLASAVVLGRAYMRERHRH